MSFFGLHVRVYNDDQWTNEIKPALDASKVDPGTGAMFTATQHMVAELLTNDPLVQAAKAAIGDATNSGLSNGQKLEKAATDVIPALIGFFTSGGVKTEAANLSSLATTFVQEVYNNSFSKAIPGLIKDVEGIFAKK